MVSRRTLLSGVVAALASACVPVRRATRAADRSEATRGVVLTVEDLSLDDWPERARRAGLTTIALHTNRSVWTALVPFLQSPRGRAFVARCARLGLEVEYEVHAVRDPLPRALFAVEPGLFRLHGSGRRTPDANLCVHGGDGRALAIAAQNALALARVLRPSTGRYFLWGDDGAAWCACPECSAKAPTASDQALLLENAIVEALRAVSPQAQLAHFAYAEMLAAPTVVRPRPGIFLEYAPFYRRYDLPLETPGDATQRAHLAALDANLALFGSDGAQALEYWLDASRFSGWQKPARRIPFDESILYDDVRAYRVRGVRHVTTFAVFVDADYVARWGEPPIEAYGAALS
jgi:hypothetical protein